MAQLFIDRFAALTAKHESREAATVEQHHYLFVALQAFADLFHKLG